MAKEYRVKTLKNGEKRYVFDVSLGTRADGTRIRTTVNAKSVKEGRKKVAELMLGKKKIEATTSTTFDEAYAMYEHYYTNVAGLGLQTIYNKKKKRNKYFHCFDNIKISKLKQVDIEDWRSRETGHLSQTTINDLEKELSAFFNWCVKNDVITSSPMKNYKKTKKSTKKMRYWTEEEFKYFLTGLKPEDEKYKLLYITLFYTGLRIGELLGLQYEDIRGNELVLSHTLKYTKDTGYYLSEEFKTTNSKRVVPIPEWLDLGEGTGVIFDVSFTSVRDKKKKACERLGIEPIRVHDFRHSYAAMLINKGVDIYVIKELLGHDTIATTLNIYGHLYDDKRKEISKLFDKI